MTGKTGPNPSPSAELQRLIRSENDGVEWITAVDELLLKTEKWRTLGLSNTSQIAERLQNIWISKPEIRMQHSALLRCLATCARNGETAAASALAECRLMAEPTKKLTIPSYLCISRSTFAHAMMDEPIDSSGLNELVNLIRSFPPLMSRSSMADLICGAIQHDSLSTLIALAHRLVDDWRLFPSVFIVWARVWPDLPMAIAIGHSECISAMAVSNVSMSGLRRLEQSLLNCSSSDCPLAVVGLRAFPDWLALSVFTRRPIIVTFALSHSNSVSCRQWVEKALSDPAELHLGKGSHEAVLLIGSLLVPVCDHAASQSWPIDRLISTVEHWIDLAPMMPPEIAVTGIERLCQSLTNINEEHRVDPGLVRERALSLWRQFPHMGPHLSH